MARHHAASLITAGLLAVAAAHGSAQAPSAPAGRDQLLSAMKRATTFMVDEVSTNGGYVWNYLPDLSRRWGELEAYESMIWVQPPGTATMGHLFLDAYHATGDEYYYDAACKATAALIWGQLPSGGWNYMIDFGGDRSLREWYATIGRNAWRLEEFQHYWGNATFDDAGTAEASKLLLRMYVEKRDPAFKPALDRAVQFVLDSQYPIGTWPQRYPLHPDYTSLHTFNDDVASENIDFLLLAYTALGDARLREPILRAMNAFVVTQQGQPQPGWGLQFTPELKPVGARTYEPDAMVTHTSARNLELLLQFYRMTGDTKFLARVEEGIDWLASAALGSGIAPAGRTHPTFIEIGTNKPLYVHRRGSNVVNGEYYVDYDPKNTIGHYSAFRAVDVPGLRRALAEARALSPEQLQAASVLGGRKGATSLPRFFVAAQASGAAGDTAARAARVAGGLNAEGYWPSTLDYNSHPYKGDGPREPAPGDYSMTHVGDDSDTSPFRDGTTPAISIAAYIRSMSALIQALDAQRSGEGADWPVDNLTRIGGHAVEVIGAPIVVPSEHGPVVEFDGVKDAIVVGANPLSSLAAFTVEVSFMPAPDGAAEQRFLHFQEDGSDDRALIELRMKPGGAWSLDTFLRSGTSSKTLLDMARLHDGGAWHRAALVYDGGTMSHYVDGVLEQEGALRFGALGPGSTTIGARGNRVSWFKGRIGRVRVTPRALAPHEMLR